MKPRKVAKNPQASARRPISLIQAGAFQAAKNRAMSRSVMMDMNPAPASTKSVKILPDKGNMVKVIEGLTMGSEFLVAKVSRKQAKMQS